jgi:hypothetical protein
MKEFRIDGTEHSECAAANRAMPLPAAAYSGRERKILDRMDPSGRQLLSPKRRLETARHGWSGTLADFAAIDPSTVLSALYRFVPDASQGQATAWRDSVRALRACASALAAAAPKTAFWNVILEYELPLEARRIDAVILANGSGVVLEFKGRSDVRDADIDQTHAYARDLRCYHEGCHDLPVYPVLVPTRAKRLTTTIRSVEVRGPAVLGDFLLRLSNGTESPICLTQFLAADAYRPLPTLVEAARELFRTGSLRRVHRAAAATDGAVEAVAAIAHVAAGTGTRHLILLTGVPGAGKTLVGLKVVHAHMLDDLATLRGGRKPAAPAVFLSGNGPLVEVLQYELKGAGGGGKTFVRGVKDYVKQYDRNPKLTPPEHVLVFDEAQRAYDAAMVAEKHKLAADDPSAKSEPEHFVEFACRVPDWCVIVGLIGNGQEINRGEEAGLRQWAEAISHSPTPHDWTVHGPAPVAAIFETVDFQKNPALSLDKSLRSHLASELHRFVADLLRRKPAPAADLADLAAKLADEGHDLLVTRDLDDTKAYLHERYPADKDKEARFGIVASSRDKALADFGIDNRSQKRPGFHGPWYGDPEGDPKGRSCRELLSCETEFGAQGLELDAVLLAWGTDFLIDGDGRWCNRLMKPHRSPKVPIADPWQLRANAYRVLLTRARDATVVFVPRVPELDATFARLRDAGFRVLLHVGTVD